MAELIDLGSARARQARLGVRIGRTGFKLLVIVCLLAIAGSVLLFIKSSKFAFSTAGLAMLFYLWAVWWKRQLSVLPPAGKSLAGRLSAETLARLSRSSLDSSINLWQDLSGHWQAGFIVNHLLLTKEIVSQAMSNDPDELKLALETAVKIADYNKSKQIELGLVVAGLLVASPKIEQVVVADKGQTEDILALADLLARTLDDESRQRSRYGGIGRDWTFGFTPLLNQFGSNLTNAILRHGVHFDWLSESESVKSIETAFSNHAHAVAIIGPSGVGKTEHVYALAQRLIEGKGKSVLAYHQVVTINATQILSTAHGPGDLEDIMLSLAAEAIHAGHIILFFDDAQLFFNDSAGAFDATQILLTIVQAKAIPIIMAMQPADYQRLRTKNMALAGLLTPISLSEPDENEVMRVLEDNSLSLEYRHKQIIVYNALREAYRLSGRYEQDEAYPGKAIKLLEQATSYSLQGIVTAQSVQAAIEQTRGVKAGSAEPAEADQLLHLEDNIHKRMINQKHAVEVVANALRRARAGVTNPKRPIGSFLFLGPTGVGKTELAKSIAAVYFGSEASMVRLDMSEYQQPNDVQRLLATGENETNSLLLAIRQQPFSVVLLDEIEKANPNVLNLLLQMLDEGQLTDNSGRTASFKDAIIIATSNAGANEIREKIAAGESLESFADEFTDQLINSGQFKPELINRFDDLVLFRPLEPKELTQVVRLMLAEVNETLTNQNISVNLTDAAIEEIVKRGNDPRLGARPMRRALQKAVEDTIAKKILSGEVQPGHKITLDVSDLNS